MNKENIKREKRVVKNSDSYKKSKKFKKCDDLFINLNKKRDFTESELKKIRLKFIEHFIMACISKSASFILSHLFLSVFSFYLFLSIIEGDFNLMSIVSYFILSLLVCGIYKSSCKELNRYASLIRIGNKISMVTTKDLSSLSNKELILLLTSEYSDALSKALNYSKKPIKFSTHELIRIRVSELYENNPDYKFECVVNSIKPIKEFMIIKSLKHLFNLYKYINLTNVESKEFKEVTKLLRANYSYDITISKIKFKEKLYYEK